MEKGPRFFDIQLPCGGGLEILLLPNPDLKVLGTLVERHIARVPVTLDINTENGELSLVETDGTVLKNDHFFLHIVKWSGKTGQRAKMYPTLKTGYTNDEETQFFR